MVCATCNSFTRQVTPVWWIYMAHILLCLSIFPKSNHSSPYDDDVVPGIPGHLPVLGICFLCVSVSVYMFVSPYASFPFAGHYNSSCRRQFESLDEVDREVKGRAGQNRPTLFGKDICFWLCLERIIWTPPEGAVTYLVVPAGHHLQLFV